MQDICIRKTIDMNTNCIYTGKEAIPDTIAALVLMQKSLLSELHRKRSNLSLTGSEARHLRGQSKLLKQQIAFVLNIVKNLECPMN